MFSRRSLIKTLTFFGAGTVLSGTSSGQKCNNRYEVPHSEALKLVWRDQQIVINDIELQFAAAALKKENRTESPNGQSWLDTDVRRWDVQRPFAPGDVDSTHLFTVTYFINDSEVGSWQVDTRNYKVAIIDKAKRK